MKKFFSYIFTFVLMFVISLATTVSISYLSADNTNIKNVNVGGQSGVNSSLFTGIIDTFDKEKKFEIQGSLDVKVKEQELPIILYVAIDMQDTSDLGIYGFVKTTINNNEQLIEFSYFKNTIYLSYNGIDIKITNQTIGVLISEIQKLLPVEETGETEGDTSSIVDQLMPVLMSALDNMKEEQLENGDKKVTISIEDLVSTKLVVTSDNKPKSVELKTANIMGVEISADLSIKFSQDLIIKNPEDNKSKNYFDVNQLIEIANNISKLENIKAGISVDLNNKDNISVEMLANIASQNYLVNLKNNSLGYVDGAEIVYKNEDLYLSFNDINLLLNEKILKSLPNLTSELMGKVVGTGAADINVKNIVKIVTNKLQNLSTDDILAILSTIKTFDIKDKGINLVLDLSKFNIGQKEIKVNIAYNKNIITALDIEGIYVKENKVDFSVIFEETSTNIELNKDVSYLDLYEVYLNNKEFVNTNSLDVDFDLDVLTKDFSLKLDSRVLVDIPNNYFAVQGNVLGCDINEIFVVYQDDIAYLCVNNIKVKASKQEIENLINKLGYKDVINKTANQMALQITEKLSSINIETVIGLAGCVKDIKVDGGKFNIIVDASVLGLKGDIELEVAFENNILKSIAIKNLSLEDSDIDLIFTINSKEVEPLQFNKNEYLDINEFVQNVQNLMYINEGTIDAIINAKVGDSNYKAVLSMVGSISDKYLSANLDLSGNVDLICRVDYIDGDLYLVINDIYVKLEDTLIAELFESINIPESSTEEIVSTAKELTLVQNISNFINDFKLENLSVVKGLKVNSSTIQIILDKSLTGAEEDLVITIGLYKNNPNELEIENLKINSEIEVSFKLALSSYFKEREIETEKYLNAEKLIGSLTDLINFESINVDGKINISSIENEIDLDLSLIRNDASKFDILNSYISANVGFGDYNLEVIYDEDVAYVKLNNIKVKMSRADAEDLIDKLNVEDSTSDIENQLEGKLEEIKSKDINELLDCIKELTIDSEFIKVKFDASIIGINSVIEVLISINDNIISKIEIGNIGVGESIVGCEFNLLVNDVEKTNINKNEYLDITKFVQNIKDLTNMNQGTINAIVNAVVNNENYKVKANLVGSIADSYLDLDLAVSGGMDLDARLTYDQNNLFVKLQEIYLSTNIDWLKEILSGFISQEDVDGAVNNLTETIKNSDIINKINELTNNLSIDMLACIKKLKVSSSSINIVIDGSIIGLSGNLNIYLGLYKSKISELEIEDLVISEDVTISAKVAISTYYKKNAIDEQKYLNLEDVEAFINKTINFESIKLAGMVNFVNNEDDITFDLSFIREDNSNFDLLNSYLSAVGSYADYEVNIVYDSEAAYIQFNDIKVKVDRSVLEQLLSMIDLENEYAEAQSDLKNAVDEKLTEIKNIDVTEVIKAIREISIDSEFVKVEYDASVIGMNSVLELIVSINDGEITKVEIKNVNIENEIINIELNLAVNNVTEAVINKPEYLDINALIENILDKQNLREGTIGAIINAQIGEDSYLANLDLRGALAEEYLSAILDLSGSQNLQARIDYVDGNLYLVVNDIYVKLDNSLITKIFADIQLPEVNTDGLVEQENQLTLVENINNFINNFSIESLNVIKKINISSSSIGLILDKSITGSENDLIINIWLNSNDPYKVEIKNLKLNDEIELSLELSLSYEYSEKELDTTKYFDVSKVLTNAESLIECDNIQIDSTIDLYDLVEEEFVNYLSLNLDLRKRVSYNDLMGYLKLELIKGEDILNLETHYLRETLFANFNGLKVSLEKAKLVDTVNTILEMLGEDQASYSEILNTILSILDNRSILELVDLESVSMPDISGIQISYAAILSLVEDITINSNQIIVNIDGTMFGCDSNINIIVSFINGNISSVTINKLKISDKYVDLTLAIETEDEVLPTVSKEEQDVYTDIYNLATLAEATYDTLKNGVISGTFDLEFDFLDERHVLEVTYGIKLNEKDLELYINTTFKGLDVNLYFIDGVFYLDVVGLKVQVAFEEINDIIAWVNEEFGTNIEFDVTQIDEIINDLKNTTTDINVDDLISTLANIDFSFMENIKLGDSIASGTIGDVRITVEYSELVNEVIFEMGSIYVDLYCTDFNDFTLNEVNTEEYSHYSVILDAYDAIMNTISSKQFNIHADAEVLANDMLEYDVDIDLAFDIVSKLSAYAQVSVVGDVNVDVNVGYMDDMLYVNYDNLRLSINQNNLREIVAIVLEIFGIDPTTVGILADVAGDLNIDTENLSALCPALDFVNPLNMLKMIKHVDIVNGVFSIVLDGKLILGDENASDMTLNLVTKDGAVQKIELLNIYSGKENGEYFNLYIDFNKFESVQAVENTESYIDISNSSDLIKAFVNTSALNDYHINGTVNVAIALGSLTLNAAAVGVDVQVKLDENKQPTVFVELNNYPLIGLVNNANTNGVGGIDSLTMRERKIYIYYKDGYCYLRTNDESWGAYKELDRITKIPPTYLFDNIEYYLQWLLGFTDTIMNEIHDAVVLAQNREEPIDISNVLLGYELKDGKHVIDINLKEIANNPDLGTMQISLSTINNQSTGNKDYLYELGIDINMLDGMIILKTDNDNKLYLIDIGKTLDFSSLDSYINNYQYYPYGEYEKKGSSSYSQVNENQSTITVNNENGETVASYTGTAGQAFNLGTPSKVVDDGITRTSYKFIGYYDENGNLFNQNYFGAGNKTITARWELESVIYYRTITLINGNSTQTIKALEGQAITLPSYDVVVEDKEFGVYTTTFLGWFHNGDNVNVVNYTYMPDFDDTLYASFETSVRKYVYLTYDFAGKGDNKVVKYLEQDIIQNLPVENYIYSNDNLRVVYENQGWFVDASCTEEFNLSVMPSANVIVYAKWVEIDRYYTRNLKVYDNGNLVFEDDLRENYNIEMYGFKIDEYTQYFLNSDFTNQYTVSTMPTNDLVLYVRNRYSLSIVSLYGNTCDKTEYYYQGESYMNNLPEQKSSSVVDDGNTRVTYTFNGWDGVTDVMPNSNLRVIANWSIDTKHYYTVTFELAYNANVAYHKYATLYKDGVSLGTNSIEVKVLEGNLDLTEYTAVWEYTTGSWIFEVDWWYDFYGFSTSKNGTTTNVVTITGDTTIYGVWSDLHSS